MPLQKTGLKSLDPTKLQKAGIDEDPSHRRIMREKAEKKRFRFLAAKQVVPASE